MGFKLGQSLAGCSFSLCSSFFPVNIVGKTNFVLKVLDCLVGPQWESMCRVLLGLDVPEWGGTQGSTPLSKKKGRGQRRKGFVRVGLGEEEV
jgi:hypothetical protein